MPELKSCEYCIYYIYRIRIDTYKCNNKDSIYYNKKLNEYSIACKHYSVEANNA